MSFGEQLEDHNGESKAEEKEQKKKRKDLETGTMKKIFYSFLMIVRYGVKGI